MNVGLVSLFLLSCVASIECMENNGPFSAFPGSYDKPNLYLLNSPAGCSEVNTLSSGQGSLGAKSSSKLSLSDSQQIPATPQSLLDFVCSHEQASKLSGDYAQILSCFKNIVDRSEKALSESNQENCAELHRTAAWAKLCLGVMFASEGFGVAQDEDVAHIFFKSAARQTSDSTASSKAALFLAKLYYKWAEQHNDERERLLQASVSCLKRAVKNELNDPESAAEAHWLLGQQSQEGEGMIRSECLAEFHYKIAQNQSRNPYFSYAAMLCLCDLVYQKKGIDGTSETTVKNKLAAQYCDTIISQATAFPDLVAQARARRCVLYAEGGFGLERNITQAAADFNLVINQKDDPSVAKKLSAMLALI